LIYTQDNHRTPVSRQFAFPSNPENRMQTVSLHLLVNGVPYVFSGIQVHSVGARLDVSKLNHLAGATIKASKTESGSLCQRAWWTLDMSLDMTRHVTEGHKDQRNLLVLSAPVWGTVEPGTGCSLVESDEDGRATEASGQPTTLPARPLWVLRSMPRSSSRKCFLTPPVPEPIEADKGVFEGTTVPQARKVD
jgi:hypothetical protein